MTRGSGRAQRGAQLGSNGGGRRGLGGRWKALSQALFASGSIVPSLEMELGGGGMWRASQLQLDLLESLLHRRQGGMGLGQKDTASGLTGLGGARSARLQHWEHRGGTWSALEATDRSGRRRVDGSSSLVDGVP